MGLPTYAQAAGFQLAEYSATGLGRAYAGEAAMADNAGSQWRNPAMLTYLRRNFLLVRFTLTPILMLMAQWLIPIWAKPARRQRFRPWRYRPKCLFLSSIEWPDLLGLAIGTNYGMETELPNFAASHFGDQAKIITAEANVNLGYQLTDAVSVGAGVRYVIGEGHFGASVPEKYRWNGWNKPNKGTSRDYFKVYGRGRYQLGLAGWYRLANQPKSSSGFYL